jgi:hypothetical protein
LVAEPLAGEPTTEPSTTEPSTTEPSTTEPRRSRGDGSLGIGSLRPALPGERGRYEASADDGNGNGKSVRPGWVPAAVIQAMTHRKR